MNLSTSALMKANAQGMKEGEKCKQMELEGPKKISNQFKNGNEN